MRRADVGSALFLLLFGLAGAGEARRLALGTPGRPGPGFFPFSLGIALALIGVALLVRAVWGGRIESAYRLRAGERPHRWKVVATLAAMFLYAFVLEVLGFVLATALLVLFLFRAIEPQPWAVALGGSLLTALGAYVLFKRWLGVQLPAGPWPG